jgi:hypothetical protein
VLHSGSRRNTTCGCPLFVIWVIIASIHSCIRDCKRMDDIVILPSLFQLLAGIPLFQELPPQLLDCPMVQYVETQNEYSLITTFKITNQFHHHFPRWTISFGTIMNLWIKTMIIFHLSSRYWWQLPQAISFTHHLGPLTTFSCALHDLFHDHLALPCPAPDHSSRCSGFPEWECLNTMPWHEGMSTAAGLVGS